MIRASAVVIDVNDLATETAFWTGLLGARAEPSTDEGWVDVVRLAEGGPMLGLQVVQEAKSAKNRLHLDLEVTDFAEARDLAIFLGATAVSDVHEPELPWQVLADPEGNEFCLISLGQPIAPV
ncbi:putative Glyoxalase domain-containing protein 4 [metagenome]|uniref:Putative Glyoxalase domain-containing protein 4 n=1 Tax=metagenome TaxID=256318 RepID=A0A2P2CC33_9ZZZZ